MSTIRILLFACFLLSDFCLTARDFVHVLTSKGVYETCEDLWFKCLAIDWDSRRLSDASHTAYIELVDPNDSVVAREKFPIVAGECDGHIYVGDDWAPGEYRMYAHTRSSVGVGDTVLMPHCVLVVRVNKQ